MCNQKRNRFMLLDFPQYWLRGENGRLRKKIACFCSQMKTLNVKKSFHFVSQNHQPIYCTIFRSLSIIETKQCLIIFFPFIPTLVVKGSGLKKWILIPINSFQSWSRNKSAHTILGSLNSHASNIKWKNYLLFRFLTSPHKFKYYATIVEF